MNLMMMGMMWIPLVLTVTAISKSIDLNMDPNNSAPLRQLWTSTGFCPPSPHKAFNQYIKEDSVRQNLAMISGLSYDPQVFQIRIHWLLDLITLDTNGSFNFNTLDRFVYNISSGGLSLGFELMGNPGGIFTDFENDTQVKLWYSLVYQIGKYNPGIHMDSLSYISRHIIHTDS